MLRSPSFVLFNINGLKSSITELKTYIFSFYPVCISLCESHLKPSQTAKIPKYQIFRKDRIGERKGGLMVLIRQDIRCDLLALKPYNGGQLECMAVRLFFQNSLVDLLLIYNPCKNISCNVFHMCPGASHMTCNLFLFSFAIEKES